MFTKGFQKTAAGGTPIKGLTGDWKINQRAAADFSRGAMSGGPSAGQMWNNLKEGLGFGGGPSRAQPPGPAPKNVGLMGG